MIKYTLEESLELLEAFNSRHASDLNAATWKPVLGCYVLRIFLNYIWGPSPSYTKKAWRSYIYKLMRDCYRPLREIPLRLQARCLLHTQKAVLLWRLRVGK
jgi:hypothetical protein